MTTTRPLKARHAVTATTLVAALLASSLNVAFSQRPADQRGEARILIETVKELGANDSGFFSIYGLTRADYARIVKTVPNIRRAIASRDCRPTARVGRNAADVLLRGTVPAYGDLGRVNVRRGRFLLEKDQKRSSNVAVISPRAAFLLFGFKDPLGQNILIDREFFLVIGVAEEPGLPREDRAVVYIPSSAMQWRMGDVEFRLGEGVRITDRYELSRIEVTVKDAARIQETAQSIRRVLRVYHKTEDYSVVIHKPQKGR